MFPHSLDTRTAERSSLTRTYRHYGEVICKGEMVLEQRAIDDRAMKARHSEYELDQLVRENNGFILRCASKTCNHMTMEEA